MSKRRSFCAWGSPISGKNLIPGILTYAGTLIRAYSPDYLQCRAEIPMGAKAIGYRRRSQGKPRSHGRYGASARQRFGGPSSTPHDPDQVQMPPLSNERMYSFIRHVAVRRCELTGFVLVQFLWCPMIHAKEDLICLFFSKTKRCDAPSTHCEKIKEIRRD
jgi:hypothetical protein